MLRLILMTLTLFSGFAQASVLLQQPITLDTGSGELFGSLLLPRSDAPVPVVLIVSGSGPTDRDGNNPDGGRTDSLKRLASVLASHNIASVRFDKRGVAASLPAAPDERTLSIEGYTADVVAWGEKLKADPRFGPLILLGHSEGALIATLAAPKLDAVALISVAGSGRPGSRGHLLPHDIPAEARGVSSTARQQERVIFFLAVEREGTDSFLMGAIPGRACQ